MAQEKSTVNLTDAEIAELRGRLTEWDFPGWVADDTIRALDELVALRTIQCEIREAVEAEREASKS